LPKPRYVPPSLPKTASIEYKPWYNAERLTGQTRVHQSKARFRTVVAGRQSGKTMVGIAEIVEDALANQNHINWWISPNYRVKDRAWRGLLAHIPRELIVKKNEAELRIRLTTGSEIFVKSADAPDSLVSEGLHFAVCDEAGQWKESAWTMGIRPMFTATHGRALLIGTPRGRNWFYRLYQMGGRDPDYESFHWKTEDSPFSDRKDLAEARKNLPTDIYLQEYEANPLDNASGVFRNVRACVRIQPAQADQFTVIGADFARKRDFSAFIPVNSSRQALYVVRSQEDWPVQKARLTALAVQNNFARIIGDESSVGDPIIQELRETGLTVEGLNTNGPIKRTIIENLRLAFEQSTITIPPDDVLIDELESYGYEMLPSGALRYAAPQGKHDDCVIALALGVWGQRASMGMVAGRLAARTSYMGRSTGGTYLGGKR